MSELLDKQVNAQKENLKNTSGIHASSRKPTKKVCDENESRKQTKKKSDRCLKYFCWEEGVYKACAESSCNGYQTISGQRFLIH